MMELHSGKHLLRTDGVEEEEEVREAPEWQGTIIYFELHTDREIDPNSLRSAVSFEQFFFDED